MHIPDAYMSPVTQFGAAALMAPMLLIAGRKTRASLSSKQVPLLSVGAGFCFAIQMFNIPAIGGTTAHALGTVLLAILLGPWAAMLTMTLTLAVQALFFGDGGILTLGVNAIDMALIPSFVGYVLYQVISSPPDIERGRGLIWSARTRSRFGLRSLLRSRAEGSPKAGCAKGTSRNIVAAAIASYAGTAAASLSAGIFLGIQPLIAHDAAGHAVYFPFGLSISVPAMVYTHLLVAAPAEAIITAFALTYLWRNFPDLAQAGRVEKAGSRFRLSRSLAFVLLLTPLGLIAGGSAWGEWDPGDLKKLVGYVPSGAAKAKELIHPLLPDYGLPNAHGHVWEIAGYLLSASIGATLVAAVIRSLVRPSPQPPPAAERGPSPGASLPEWMMRTNRFDAKPLVAPVTRGWFNALRSRARSAGGVLKRSFSLSRQGLAEPNAAASLPHSEGASHAFALAARRTTGKPWIEALLLRMRATMEETIATETVARRPGVLQRVRPSVKAGLVFCGLVAIAIAQSPVVLIAIVLVVALAAASSKVPLWAFARRVLFAVAFFGLIVAAPLALQAVSPGRAAWGPFSVPGLALASTMLLRLGCGIGLTLLWTLTTRWNDLVRSLRSLGLPAFFCTGITLAYRYLFVTMDTLEEMVVARRSRQAGACDKGHARGYAGAGAAILFAKSYAFTEELHMAMRSRSFDRVAKRAPLRWSRTGVVSVVGGLFAVLIFVSLR